MGAIFGIGLFLLVLPFSLWFKFKQLSLASPQLVSVYPIKYWAHTHAVFFLLTLAFCLLLFTVFRHFFCLKSESGGPALKLRHSTGVWLKHVNAFLIILFIQIFFARFISPLNWNNPIATLNNEESAFLGLATPLHKSMYAEAKRFDFGGFEHSVWGTFPYPLAQDSLLVSTLTWALDLPVIDVESFLRLLLTIFFVLTVFAGFGFYLFLHKSLKISAGISLLVGSLYTVGNPYFSNIFTHHFPIFSGPYLLLPFNLILLWAAFEKKRGVFAALSGLVLSLNLYLLQPHPDVMLHAFVFLGVIICYLGFLKQRSFGLTFKLGLLFILGAACGAAYGLGAVFEALKGGEGAVLGHQDGIICPWSWRWGLQQLLSLHASSYFLYIPFVLYGWWQALPFIRKGNYRDAIFFFVLALLFLVGFAGGRDGLVEWILRAARINSFSFIFSYRVFSYYALLLFIVLAYGLEFFRLWGASISAGRRRVLNFLVLLSTLGLFAHRFPCLKQFVLPSAILWVLIFLFSRRYEEEGIRPSGPLICFSVLLLAHQGSLVWLSPGLEGNSDTKKPYVYLATLLMKGKLFPEDHKASTKLITQRLRRFEVDANRKILSEGIEPLRIAEREAATIDEFYVQRGAMKTTHNWMLYYTGVPKFSWITHGTGGSGKELFHETYMGGIGEGLFTHNFSQNPDLRMLVGYPPLNALYVVPGNYFSEPAGYASPSQWSVQLNAVTDPLTRKLFNIGGIDYHTFKSDDYSAVGDKRELSLLPTEVPKDVQSGFSVVQDLRSYGMAYLASQIHFVSPEINRLDYLMPPFDKKPPEYFNQYKRTVDLLNAKLMSLTQKHEIFLERKGTEIERENTGGSENSLRIENISGNKAIFQVHCAEEPCQLVYNQAAQKNWTAYVDSQQTNISRANFAFLSVAVNAGDHLVWFEYRPWGRIVGAYLTLFFLIGTLVQLIQRQLRHQPLFEINPIPGLELGLIEPIPSE